MIEIDLSPEILAKHREWVFGENKNKENRLYSKIYNITTNTNNEDIKNILEYIFDNLESIITGNLLTLNSIVKEYESKLNKLRKNDTGESKKVRGRNIYRRDKERELISILSNLFEKEYEYFYTSSEWNAYEYHRLLDISVCPYCASQFIFLSYENGKKTRATLDHFFDKATYPFLGISIYNLVPACKVCNSDYKGTSEMQLDTNYSPFEKGILEKMNFRIDVSKIHDKKEIDYYNVFIGNNTDFNIGFSLDKDYVEIENKIRGNIEIFNLDEIYNKYHKSYVKGLIRKAYIYNLAYLNQLKLTHDMLFTNEIDFLDSLYPAVSDDKFNILGKLTRDIIESELKYYRNKDSAMLK